MPPSRRGEGVEGVEGGKGPFPVVGGGGHAVWKTNGKKVSKQSTQLHGTTMTESREQRSKKQRKCTYSTLDERRPRGRSPPSTAVRVLLDAAALVEAQLLQCGS